MNCECTRKTHDCKLVVLTGGPGAGKTAVLELARRSLCEHIAILPEAASIVFSGGFPRKSSDLARKAAQEAIVQVQKALEKIALGEHLAAVALCDRGIVDGLAYWPGSEAEFWQAAGTSKEEEFKRYSAVIHLRSPQLSQGYNYSNPIRTESNIEALAIDQKLLEAWKGHSHHYVIGSEDSFITKAEKAVEIIQQQLPDCCRSHNWKIALEAAELKSQS